MVCIWSSVYSERDTSTILWIKSALLDIDYKKCQKHDKHRAALFKECFSFIPPPNYLLWAACCHAGPQWWGQLCRSHEPQCFCTSVGTLLNIWTLLIKSYLDSVLLSLTDSKVIKLLKGVTSKIVVSRLRQERLIKWPLLLLTSSKSAFFSPRQTNVRECGFFSSCCEHTAFFFLLRLG